jgi:hypothetical protein
MNKKLPNQRRQHTVKVSLTAAEYDQLQERAATTGGKLATYCRLKALDQRQPAPPTIRQPQTLPVQSELRQLRTDLGKVGNNLNQIAHHLNQRQPLDDITALELKQQLTRLDDALVNLKAELNPVLR